MEEDLTDLLLSSEYWESDQSHIYHNTFSKQLEKGVGECQITQEILTKLPAHLFFQTSGSTGKPKWVALSKKAMLASAAAVNKHLGVGAEKSDNWFLALPIFHVGGHAIFARAYMSGSKVTTMQGKWHVEHFLEQLSIGEPKSTWISLVPTQLVDIVQNSVCAPSSLKGCILGGGGIEPSVLSAAQDLGWRVHQSYGMTEAASQIATAKEPNGELEVLPHISCVVTNLGTLQWTGESQLSGYVVDNKFIPQRGWIDTKDKVSLIEGSQNSACSNAQVLKFIGRSDRTFKVLGELVDVESLEKEINESADQQLVIRTSKDARRGVLLIPVVENEPSLEMYDLLAQYKGIYQLEACKVELFRRSALGKMMY